ncbi:DUF3006 domain-containing protein [Natronospora cellulosivora (SeqCode)]
MKVTIDRFENGQAVLLIREDEKEEIILNKKHLPAEVKEGDILDVNFKISKSETKEAEKRVANLLDKLKNKQK